MMRCLFSLTLLSALAASSRGQQLQTLYSFAQPPANPAATVVQGPDGNFYGTTYDGGAFGYGSVFRVTTNGVLTDLVDFNTVNGAYPDAGLVSDANGSFYGTTKNGGAEGYGTVFRVTTNGTFTTLITLYPAIGANPTGNLIWGPGGNLYGTTSYGGTNNDGTVFEITTNGMLTTLHSFSGADGANPAASLLLASDGNFYGTTAYGGNGLGSVFRLTSAGVLTDLGSFDYLNNGAFPKSGLVEDGAGNLYGTATAGGGSGAGSGTLFEIPATNNQTILGLVTFTAAPGGGLVAGASNIFYGATSGTLYEFKATNAAVVTLVSFGFGNGFDAVAPPTLDARGNLLGTTYEGGTNGYGTVYELATNGVFTTLYAFQGSPGAQPNGGLVQDAQGTLYGTTYSGGMADNGTVFSLNTNGIFRVLTNFNSGNGAYPEDGLLLATNGYLYGTTYLGGGNGAQDGTVFQVSGDESIFNTLMTFSNVNGAFPSAGLISDAGGNLYGTTYHGGVYGDGTVFRLATNGILTTLAIFDGTNGSWPNSTLTLDAQGNLWGTTVGGGGGLGAGTIFSVPTNGVPATTLLTPVAVFNGQNGSIPQAGLTLGPDGAFYGTTEAGGAHNKGVVFRVTTNGTIATLVSFMGGNNGAYPVGGLIPGTNGVFFGTTSGAFDNQTNGFGTVFRVSTNGTLTTFWAFSGTNGSAPEGSLLKGNDGALYGATQYGGPSGSGTLFKLLLGPVYPTPLIIQEAGTSQVLTWANPVFSLQAAPTVSGPFTNVPYAFSPYTNTLGGRTTFFRLEASTN